MFPPEVSTLYDHEDGRPPELARRADGRRQPANCAFCRRSGAYRESYFDTSQSDEKEAASSGSAGALADVFCVETA